MSAEGVWGHLFETRLREYVTNTVWLTVGVGGTTLVVGTLTAWLVTMYRFPGRSIFQWLLVLPLAMPAYVLAYTYTDFLQVTGPLQTLLREVTGWGVRDYWFPRIRSVEGAIFVLSMALYPYVYVAARAAFISQSRCLLEVSRSLGYSPWGTFWRTGLPLARPAILAGTLFVIMESLADFGAVAHFEVHTFTTGIYRTWYAFGNPAAAAQLASVLLLFVYGLLVLERYTEGQRRFADTTTRYHPLPPVTLTGGKQWIATLCCLLPVTLGFLLPGAVLLAMFWTAEHGISAWRLWQLSVNTAILSLVTTLIVLGVASGAVYSVRRGGYAVRRNLLRVGMLGYATPGIVIAVGLLITLGTADHFLSGWGILLSGSIFAVVYGCTVRFFAVAYGPLEAGFKKVRPHYEDAARSLGATPDRIARKIHWPLMRGSVLSAALLVFVDVMKELPVTMILRPFNFDTLAVFAYQMASDERLDGAAGPSLVIVLAGLIPVILLCRAMSRSRTTETHLTQDPCE